MSTVNQKYLKDEEGNIFTPIVSHRSVYNDDNKPIAEGAEYIRLAVSNTFKPTDRTTIKFDKVVDKTDGVSYNANTGIVTLNAVSPKIAVINVNLRCNWSSTNYLIYLYISKNNSEILSKAITYAGNTGDTMDASITTLCKKGDTFKIDVNIDENRLVAGDSNYSWAVATFAFI